jgi:hypothetical protein
VDPTSETVSWSAWHFPSRVDMTERLDDVRIIRHEVSLYRRATLLPTGGWIGGGTTIYHAVSVIGISQMIVVALFEDEIKAQEYVYALPYAVRGRARYEPITISALR